MAKNPHVKIKDKVIMIRVTDRQLETYKAAANERGITLSELARVCIETTIWSLKK